MYKVPSDPKTKALAVPTTEPKPPTKVVAPVLELTLYRLENEIPYRSPEGLNAMSVRAMLVFPMDDVAPVATSTVANPAPPVLTQSVGAAYAAMAAENRTHATLVRLIHFEKFIVVLRIRY